MKKIILLFITLTFSVQAQTDVFFTIHCEPNNSALFPKLVELVQLADQHNIPLTIEMTPQWASAVISNPIKLQIVRDWQAAGHEIGAHHHGIEAGAGWDGYTNSPPEEIIFPDLYEGNMLNYLDILSELAGDSLLMTGGFGPDDIDWPVGVVYKTWGHELEDAISQPIYEIINDCDRWTLGYSNVTNDLKADQLIALYPTAGVDDIFGMVTHVYNFNDSELYLRKLFDFFEDKNCKTVRRIMSGRSLTSVNDLNNDPNSPFTFQLYQNYPNPFNPGTIISFLLDEPGKINLSIFDLLGRKIISLVDKEMPAGFHQIIFNSSNIPCGVYFYNLTDGKKVKTKKLVILK